VARKKYSHKAILNRMSWPFLLKFVLIMTLVRLKTGLRLLNGANYINKGYIASGTSSGPRLSPSVRFYSRISLNCNSQTDRVENPNYSWSIICKSAEDIEKLGSDLAALLCPGDVVLLKGDLGAGKTTLVRGLIRNKNQDDNMVVTSPSYLLDNVYCYDEDEKKIHHMDLYRLPNDCDMSVLGMPGIFEDCLCLIEWPERINREFYPKEYLEVNLSISEDESRVIRFQTSNGSYKWKKMESLFS